MILNNEEFIKLKVLILGVLDEEDNDNCMKCTPENTCCSLISACNKYGSFNLIGGANDMVRDLFDTIEDMKDELFEQKIVDNCINCERSDNILERCILEGNKELECLSDNYSYHVRKKEGK